MSKKIIFKAYYIAVTNKDVALELLLGLNTLLTKLS
jgi:hypothetical protein